MKTEKEKRLEIALIKEKLERISGKKVLFKEERKLSDYSHIVRSVEYPDKVNRFIQMVLDSGWNLSSEQQNKLFNLLQEFLITEFGV